MTTTVYQLTRYNAYIHDTKDAEYVIPRELVNA